MLRKFVSSVLPKSVKNRLVRITPSKSIHQREKIEKQIPKVGLSEKHIKNCTLLLNRADLLSKLKKQGVVAEIGVDHGTFSEHILDVTEPKKLHLIDIWESDRYHSGLFELVTRKFSELINSGRVVIHRKYSTEAAADFQDDYFDWIYLDTTHAYDLTREELEKYASKIKQDGVIAGHDYSMGNWVTSFRYGVIEAVHEFCVKNDWELIYLTVDPIEIPSFAIRRIR